MEKSPVVFVTGCSSGFGFALAESLSKKGMNVFAGIRDISGRNATAAARLRDACAGKGSLRIIELDVSSDESVGAAVQQALHEADHIDVLINNAGFSFVGPMEAFTIEQWERLFSTNFFGAVRMNRAVLPSMRRRRKGLLIHISSVGGRIVAPGQGIYGATKHALGALAEAYRYELAPFGIDSVLVEPFFYSTGIFGKITGPDDESCAAEYVPAGDIGRRHSAFLEAAVKAPTVGQPSEIAEAVFEIIEKPFGKRPLHTVLPAAMAAALQPLDSLLDQIQRRVMERLGFSDLLEQHEHSTV
jgi:NAD(P)-dependent dehydrogenase (short-subunit alcohol dehydrogenase family)